MAGPGLQIFFQPKIPGCENSEVVPPIVLTTEAGVPHKDGSRTPNEPWKYPGCLGYIGDYTTQLFRDYNKPL